MEIKVTCKGAASASLEKLEELQGDLKKITNQNMDKLKRSILKYGVTAPVFVWKDKDSLRMIDGHQRVKALKELEKTGHKVPKIPIAYVYAENEKEAKEKLLHITSQYGTFDNDGTIEFMANLDFEEVMSSVRLSAGEFRVDTEEEEEEEPEIEFTQELMESHNYIVLVFDNDIDWLQAQSMFGLKTVAAKNSKPGFEKKGVGRVLKGSEALNKIS